jgi:hypothetical protein
MRFPYERGPAARLRESSRLSQSRQKDVAAAATILPVPKRFCPQICPRSLWRPANHSSLPPTSRLRPGAIGQRRTILFPARCPGFDGVESRGHHQVARIERISQFGWLADRHIPRWMCPRSLKRSVITSVVNDDIKPILVRLGLNTPDAFTDAVLLSAGRTTLTGGCELIDRSKMPLAVYGMHAA